MKMLIFLLFIVAIVSAMIWKMRKSQAEAALARREEIKRRRKLDQEAVTPEIDMVWPVIIRPVTGQDSNAKAEEPSMTAIEYEPPEQAAS